jgi:hypothetical protein
MVERLVADQADGGADGGVDVDGRKRRLAAHLVAPADESAMRG